MAKVLREKPPENNRNSTPTQLPTDQKPTKTKMSVRKNSGWEMSAYDALRVNYLDSELLTSSSDK